MKAYTIAHYGKEVSLTTFKEMVNSRYEGLEQNLIELALEDTDPNFFESEPGDIYFEDKNEAANKVNWVGDVYTFSNKGVEFIRVCIPALETDEVDEDHEYINGIGYDIPSGLFSEEDLERVKERMVWA